MSNRWIMILGLVVSLVSYLFWREIKEATGISVFYQGNAIYIALITFMLFRLSEPKNKWIAFTLFLYACNHVVDEVVMPNKTKTIVELIIAILSPLLAFKKYGKVYK